MEESDYLALLKSKEALQYWELHKVIQKFNELDIPVMLVKGAIDLAVPHNRPSGSLPRDMGDLDLLIHKSDWDDAVQGLYDLGYRPLDLEDENDRFDVAGQRAFIKSEPHGRIDLHYDLNKSSDREKFIQTEVLWQRSSPVEFKGTHAVIPSVTDQLWYQLVHLFLFHTDSLEAMIGKTGRVWRIIGMANYNNEHIDWNELMSRAHTFNVELLICFLGCGMKSKYSTLPGFKLNDCKLNSASLIWEWMIHAQRMPKILNYAIGRFTILTLFRKYNLFKICSLYYGETIRQMSKEILLQKYRLSHLPFLYPVTRLLHLARLMLLHLVIGAYYIGFLWKEKRNRNTFSSREGN